MSEELPIIQKTYDLIRWYVPLVNKMPRSHRFGLGDRIVGSLYTILDQLITARYSRSNLALLREINVALERLRYQTRLLRDFDVFSVKRYEFAIGLLLEIGGMLGNWIKQQQARA